jgi:hypothetical protein
MSWAHPFELLWNVCFQASPIVYAINRVCAKIENDRRAIQRRLHVHRIELDCGRIQVRLGFASTIAMVGHQKLGQLKLSKSYFRTELHSGGNIQCLLEISRRLIGVAQQGGGSAKLTCDTSKREVCGCQVRAVGKPERYNRSHSPIFQGRRCFQKSS